MKSAVEFIFDQIDLKRICWFNRKCSMRTKKRSTSVWLEGADVSDRLFLKLKSNLSVKRSILFQFSKLVKKRTIGNPFLKRNQTKTRRSSIWCHSLIIIERPEHTFKVFLSRHMEDQWKKIFYFKKKASDEKTSKNISKCRCGQFFGTNNEYN